MGDAVTIDLFGAAGEDPAFFVEEAEKELRGRKVIYGKFEAGDNKLIKTVRINFNQAEWISYTKPAGKDRFLL